MHKQHFPTSYDDASNLMYTQERIIIRQKCFRVIAYRLMNGEIAVPTRKMTAQVHKCELEGEQFIKSLGLEPSRVVLPNHVVTDMISISHAFDFWKYLNESGKGNPWTKLGQQFLEQYFSGGVGEWESGRVRKEFQYFTLLFILLFPLPLPLSPTPPLFHSLALLLFNSLSFKKDKSMSEEQNQSLTLRLQLLSSYLEALEKEDVETANKIFETVHSDTRLKHIISEINIAYQQEDLTSATLKETGLLSDKIRLAIIENHHITRVGMRTTLSESPDIEVVGEASSYPDGLLLLQQQQPDVAIINVDLPGKNGIELTRQLKESNLAVKSLIMAKYENTETVLGAFAAGANSYCVKDIDSNHLLEAIRVTHSGKNWIDPVVTKNVLDVAQTHFLYTGHIINAQDNGALVEEAIQFCELTTREIEILQFLASGHKNADIAEKLYITVGTVKSHISNLLIKLGVTDRTQAVLYALRFGIVHLE